MVVVYDGRYSSVYTGTGTSAAEGLKKWDGCCSSTGRNLGWGLNPYPVLGVRRVTAGSGDVTPGKFFENIGASLCNLVHLGDIRSSKVGRKIDFFSVPLLKDSCPYEPMQSSKLSLIYV